MRRGKPGGQLLSHSPSSFKQGDVAFGITDLLVLRCPSGGRVLLSSLRVFSSTKPPPPKVSSVRICLDSQLSLSHGFRNPSPNFGLLGAYVQTHRSCRTSSGPRGEWRAGTQTQNFWFLALNPDVGVSPAGRTLVPFQMGII